MFSTLSVIGLNKLSHVHVCILESFQVQLEIVFFFSILRFLFLCFSSSIYFSDWDSPFIYFSIGDLSSAYSVSHTCSLIFMW